MPRGDGGAALEPDDSLLDSFAPILGVKINGQARSPGIAFRLLRDKVAGAPTALVDVNGLTIASPDNSPELKVWRRARG